MKDYALNDPIVAIATALAPSALSIVRASGDNAVTLASKAFSRPDALLKAKGQSLVHGWILDANMQKIDEVMVAVYYGPKSFTGEDSVEIIGHGGISTVLAVYRRLVEVGFRKASRGEFTFRAFANGKADLTQAEAVNEIINSRTNTAREKAVERLSGNLSKKINNVVLLLVNVLSAIGVTIEYPEDEETTKGAYDEALVLEAKKELENLRNTWASEKILQEGSKLVLAGRTNAGKSSLFNVLLKEERAIVSNIHGTTRDWIESKVDFLGIPVSLYDTAGIRYTEDSIEAEGVQRSLNLVEIADAILYLVDAKDGLNENDVDFINKNKEQKGPPIILVWNKIDFDNAKPCPNKVEGIKQILKTSVKENIGIQELVKTVVEIITKDKPITKEVGLGTERQKQSVEQALYFIEHAENAVKEGFPMDAISQDIEDAINSLSEITGEITSDDILGNIFSNFCVGK